jgi:hypothetical protein
VDVNEQHRAREGVDPISKPILPIFSAHVSPSHERRIYGFGSLVGKRVPRSRSNSELPRERVPCSSDVEDFMMDRPRWHWAETCTTTRLAWSLTG